MTIGGMSKERKGLNILKVSSSGRMATMEYAHLAVHEDGFVTATDYVADLDIITPRRYHIKAIAGIELHSVFLIKVSAACRVQIYEGPTVTAAGTRLTHMRNNRNSAVADNARDTTYHTPTTTDNGTLIYDSYTGGQGGNQANRAGGESREGQEIVLKRSTPYLVVVTAVADNTILALNHEYYEVAY